MGKKRKNSGFKAPKGYFEGFTDDLLDKMSKETSSLPKEDGFAVPESYFDNLNKKILDKVSEKESKVIRLKPYRKYFYVAASVAAILILVLSIQRSGKSSFTFDDLARTDIENYLEENELGLSTYELAEVLLIEELEVNDILNSELDDENIIDYLEDNIDDIDELNLEIDE
ncbi:hypothetical protein [uncultured Eudoraea sp.]|uniref:hypothetical protein n=1 Tax=uncultured Eudoraea sp. TaxID=1035614 RepID=UPI002615573B|nr:hypothetical protein [uncultured Eudoraea sp.]